MTFLPSPGSMAAVSAAVPGLAAAGAQLILTPRRVRKAAEAQEQNAEMAFRVEELQAELEEETQARAAQEERQEALAQLQLEAARAEGLQRAEELMTELSQVCLLYTSPSPRDKRQSRMPSSA